jgi:hypothetical protein
VSSDASTPDAAALRGQPVLVDVAPDARLAVGAGADAAWAMDVQRSSLLRLRY